MPDSLKSTWPWLLLVAANGLILLDAPPVFRFGAALLLLIFLPGWAWLRSCALTDGAERVTLAAGLSLALTVLAAMFAVYLPGPLSLPPLLILIDLITILGLLIPSRSPAPLPPPSPALLPRSPAPYLLLLAILLLTAALRLPRLGYAEFHEDEAEALMLGVRLFQGEDYALFLHRKGPAQMLVPVAVWLLTGQINETLARFPFALSSLLSVAALFFLGRRWFSWPVGAIAALLWAVNGYSLAFGRMVQYQALIFFLGPLALYGLTLARQQRQLRWHTIAAVLLAVCLLAHFDALLLLPAAGYLWSRGAGGQRSRGAEEQPFDRLRMQGSGGAFLSPLLPRSLAPLLFIALLATFYIPYLLDPEFTNTAAYLTESRVKPGLLYNNLGLLARLDGDYSSRFYLPLLAIGLGLFLLARGRALTRRWQVGLLGLGLLAVSTIWLPDLWRLGSLNLVLLPWLLLGLLLFWPLPQPEIRAALLLFGAPLIGYVFLVDDPRTHLYIAYPGAVMLAGVGWVEIRGLEIGRWGDWSKTSTFPCFFLTAAGLCLGAIILYEATIFLRTESGLDHLRASWDGSLWETLYDDLPASREYFGYPKREGWKAIGALRAEGLFPGDFRSVNEDFITPIWYNFGQARSCYDTPAYFFVRPAGEEMRIASEGYHPVAQIEREEEVRLHVFSAGEPPAGPLAVYELEPLVAAFDRLATPQQFAQQAEPAQAVGTQFGPAILFTGYDLPTTTVAPGATLYLDLYWQALAPPGDDYRAFAHLTDGRTLWAQQDDNLACRLPTSIWRAGQRGLGQFRLTVNPDTPPGRYPLVIGVYQAQTLERLQITAGAGQVGDDFLWLGDIEVRAP